MLNVLRLIPFNAYLTTGAVVIALAAGWWALDTYQDGRAAEARVEVLLREAEDARNALTRERARAAADLAAVEEEAAQERARAESVAALLESIDQSDAGRDAPVAPVLLDTLRRLR